MFTNTGFALRASNYLNQLFLPDNPDSEMFARHSIHNLINSPLETTLLQLAIFHNPSHLLINDNRAIFIHTSSTWLAFEILNLFLTDLIFKAFFLWLDPN